MNQWLALWPIFLSGVTTGEMLQWCLWKGKHPDDPWLGYWNVGFAHVGVNLAVVIVCLVAWHEGILAALVEKFGGTPIAQPLTVSPPVGFLVVVLADVFGDSIAYAARIRGKRLMKSTPEAGSKPMPPAGAGGVA